MKTVIQAALPHGSYDSMDLVLQSVPMTLWHTK